MATAEKMKAKTVAAMERVFRAARELVEAERKLRAEAEGSVLASAKQRARTVGEKESDHVQK